MKDRQQQQGQQQQQQQQHQQFPAIMKSAMSASADTLVYIMCFYFILARMRLAVVQG
jgi:hypothetical protein